MYQWQRKPTLQHLVILDGKVFASVYILELVEQYILLHFVKYFYFVFVFFYFVFVLIYFLLIHITCCLLQPHTHNFSPIFMNLLLWSDEGQLSQDISSSTKANLPCPVERHWGYWKWMPSAWHSSCSNSLALRSSYRTVLELGTSSRWSTRSTGFVNVLESIFPSNLLPLVSSDWQKQWDIRHLFQEFPIVLTAAVQQPTKLAKFSEVTQGT